MKNILVKVSSSIENRDGKLILSSVSDETLQYEKITLLRNFGSLVVVSGNPKFHFSLTKDLAMKGAVLLGAYHENQEITAALSLVAGADNIKISKGDACLVIESVEADNIKVVETNEFFVGGVLQLDVKAAPKKRGRRRK